MKCLQDVPSAALFVGGFGIFLLIAGCAKQVTGGVASQQQVRPVPPIGESPLPPVTAPPSQPPADTSRMESMPPAPLAPPPEAPQAERAPVPPPPPPPTEAEALKPEVIPPPPVVPPEERVTEALPPAPVSALPSAPALLPPAPAVASPTPPAATLSDIYFDYDQFVLKSEARSVLEGNARLLQNGLNGLMGPIVIEGHCDERGTHAYNMVLGERRAQAVKRFLVDLGVAKDRLTIVSYGKERPFCTEHSEACWQENRRAHFLPR